MNSLSRSSIIELRVRQDVGYSLDYLEENAEENLIRSLKEAKEKVKLLKPDSVIAILSSAGLSLICGEEEEKVFFRDFFRPELKCRYKYYKSFKEFLSARCKETIKYQIGRIEGMLYYLNEEGEIISEDTFNTYKDELQAFDSRGYGTNPKKIGNINIKDMRIKKNLCISYALYHGISLDEVIDVYNNDDLELLD